MSKRWHYFGDVRLTEGGFYWREDGADDYVCAVDVTPCSNAGGPSNLFHIEAGSIFLPVNDPDRLASALACCGWSADDALTITGNGAPDAVRGRASGAFVSSSRVSLITGSTAEPQPSFKSAATRGVSSVTDGRRIPT